MGQLINIEEIKSLFPDEWVLIGNPVMDESKIDILSGIPILHSKDKKEVCYLGKTKTADFETVTIVFTGVKTATRALTGIFKRH